jgi:hypothetical protein
MRVSCRLAMLGLSVVVLAPGVARAAPILAGSPGTSCGALVSTATTNCSLFTIDPLLPTSVSGQFEFDNDVALFQFVVGPGTYTFAAGSTSAATGIDPILALFQGDGSAFTYTTPEGEFRALGFDPVPDVDAALPLLTLTGGTYFLALTQFGPFAGNFPIGNLIDGFDQDAFPCFTFQFEPCLAGDPSLFGGQTGNFSLNVTLTPTGTARVPEPSTLVLLALGSIGAGVIRHRQSRRRAGAGEPRS